MSNREHNLRNGEAMNRNQIEKEDFNVGDRFFLMNPDYSTDFRITEARSDNGTQFRRMQGGPNDTVVDLKYLQQEFAMGRLSRLDKDGKPLKEGSSNDGD